jgi:hypothetical protein
MISRNLEYIPNCICCVIVCSVLYCLCSFVCCVLFECGVLFCVMCVICVLSYCSTTVTG